MAASSATRRRYERRSVHSNRRLGKVSVGTVTLAHGGGGKAMKDLIDDVFVAAFDHRHWRRWRIRRGSISPSLRTMVTGWRSPPIPLWLIP